MSFILQPGEKLNFSTDADMLRVLRCSAAELHAYEFAMREYVRYGPGPTTQEQAWTALELTSELYYELARGSRWGWDIPHDFHSCVSKLQDHMWTQGHNARWESLQSAVQKSNKRSSDEAGLDAADKEPEKRGLTAVAYFNEYMVKAGPSGTVKIPSSSGVSAALPNVVRHHTAPVTTIKRTMKTTAPSVQAADHQATPQARSPEAPAFDLSMTTGSMIAAMNQVRDNMSAQLSKSTGECMKTMESEVKAAVAASVKAQEALSKERLRDWCEREERVAAREKAADLQERALEFRMRHEESVWLGKQRSHEAEKKVLAEQEERLSSKEISIALREGEVERTENRSNERAKHISAREEVVYQQEKDQKANKANEIEFAGANISFVSATGFTTARLEMAPMKATDYGTFARMKKLLCCEDRHIRRLEVAVRKYIKDYAARHSLPPTSRETWQAIVRSDGVINALLAGPLSTNGSQLPDNFYQDVEEMKKHLYLSVLQEGQPAISKGRGCSAQKPEAKKRWDSERDQDDDEPSPVKKMKTESAHTAEAQKQPSFQLEDTDQRSHLTLASHKRVSDMERGRPHAGNNDIIEQPASRPIAPQIVSPAIEDYHPMSPGQKQAPLSTAVQPPGSLEELLMARAQKSAGETVLAVEAHIKAAVDERVREQNARLKDDRLALNRAEARRIMGEAALEEARAEYETKKTADIDMLAEREQLLMKREENMAELRKENAECKARCDSLEATLKTTSKRLKEANEKEARLSDLAAKHAKAVEDFKRAIQ
ncbi:uncharacterized protein MYCGRDRAFT_92972 [Zymoseptoria tritici IPO323]|uniref:Uncharacterized protein n=1 Tax=Zymoseptoria tritici (strain CBS 115943 / IPO323) TaxID=336722 RepID=F9XAL9_ZYMTI|nr:uncharacterized protein MYCGRDRAFT_92972 [Zymoseptoria tritici IPO323]EGP87021.1 hypothetical protein MYCGRDRAFT_92972 [Zymoseptoria tritici IPO323]